MAGKSLIPIFTENFERNLDQIRLFLEPEKKKAFQHLLDRLFNDAISTLCQYPQAGRPFLNHQVRSLETRRLLRKLKQLLKKDDDIREWIMDDYLVLYLHRDDQIIFLSIKHHFQLSFDLSRFWL